MGSVRWECGAVLNQGGDPMKEFLIGLLVIAMVLILSGLGILMLPLFLLLGIFLRMILGLILLIVVVWLIGKVTLLVIELFKAKEPKKE